MCICRVTSERQGDLLGIFRARSFTDAYQTRINILSLGVHVYTPQINTYLFIVFSRSLCGTDWRRVYTECIAVVVHNSTIGDGGGAVKRFLRPHVNICYIISRRLSLSTIPRKEKKKKEKEKKTTSSSSSSPYFSRSDVTCTRAEQSYFVLFVFCSPDK